MNDKQRDPLLPEGISDLEKSEATPEILNSGYSLISLDSRDLDRIGKFFNRIFENCKSPRNGITFLKGAIFALGSKDFGNKQWREHCSSSLRELFHEWRDAGKICSAFNKTFNDLPNTKNPNDYYRLLQEFYKYFSCICHHDNTGTLYSLRRIHNQEDIQAGDETPELFIKTVDSFLLYIKGFIDRHIKGEL